MANYLLLFKSLTSAQRAEKVLKYKGIPAKISRVPGEIPTNGCTYCIKIDESVLKRSLTALNNAELSPTKIFAWFGEGKFKRYVNDLPG